MDTVMNDVTDYTTIINTGATGRSPPMFCREFETISKRLVIAGHDEIYNFSCSPETYNPYEFIY